MPWIDNAVLDYGKNIGFEGLAFNERGVVNLQYESVGSLYFERVDNGLLIYVARQIERLEATHLRSALEVCHWKSQNSFPVNAALHKENVLVFSVMMNEEEVSVPTIEEVIRLLDNAFEQILEGVEA